MRSLLLLAGALYCALAVAVPKPPVLLDNGRAPIVASGPGFAIDFDYVVPASKSSHLALSAWNQNIQYQTLSNSSSSWPNRYKVWRLGNGTVGTAEFSQWMVDSLPLNGTLYDRGQALTSPGEISDADALVYVPNPNYVGPDSFTYRAFSRTAQAATSPATVRLNVASTSNYPLPVGFDKPWGLDLEPPADPAEWPNQEKAGFYYIDSDHPNCDDSSDYGYPAQPRCSFVPRNAVVPAGAKMVLAASSEPYRLTNAGSHRLHLLGTAQAPAWLVGVDDAPVKPLITTAAGRDAFSEFQVNGSYMVVSGISLKNAKITHRHNKEDQQVDDYIMFRHSEVYGYTGRAGNAISIAGVSGMDRNATNVNIFNVSVHDNGDRDPQLAERDVHGMGFGSCTDCTILDVVSYGNGGDSYQNLQHNNNVDIRIGRLKGHSEGENCVDIKAQRGLWVMDSDCWDLRSVHWSNGSTGNGQGFFQNDDDCSNAADCEQLGDVIFLNNRAWDTNGPGFGSSISNGSHYIVGNRAFAMPAGSCISVSNADGHQQDTSATHVYFNSMSNCGVGIRAQPNADVTRIVGNVVDNSAQNFWMLNRKNFTLLDRNYYTSAINTASFQCCSNSNAQFHNGLASWQAISTHDVNSVAGVQPGFESALDGKFSINSTSQLKDRFSPAEVNSLMPGIAEMLGILGVDSVQDWNGTRRFDGQPEDAGADEY